MQERLSRLQDTPSSGHSVKTYYTKTGMPKAVCLLSGGLDSSTSLALARREGYASCYALSFDYGQRRAERY